MSEVSETSLQLNIYEEALNEDTILDLSSQGLEIVPEIKNHLLQAIYLQNNNLTILPEDFFPSLCSLMYLDLRDNRLTDIPKTVKHHPTLTHLLLQNNRLTSLPDELGTVPNLKVIQLSGNPLMYPPRDVISAGADNIAKFLNEKYLETYLIQSNTDLLEDNPNDSLGIYSQGISYNSVLDEGKSDNKPLLVQFSEKELDSDEECYAKIKGKCPKLGKSRHKSLPPYYQSSKYLKPVRIDANLEKIRQDYFKKKAIQKHKYLLDKREKILQDRKNLELLKNWRSEYRNRKYLNPHCDYKLTAENFPYDTSPDYMSLLTRDDIEKDLPDKYKRKLVRRSKQTVPRKSNNDVHLAMKIKQLFENLEAIDLNREGLTPRTEQKVLLNEIQKISEIKQKLMELSTSNARSVTTEEN